MHSSIEGRKKIDSRKFVKFFFNNSFLNRFLKYFRECCRHYNFRPNSSYQNVAFIYIYQYTTYIRFIIYIYKMRFYMLRIHFCIFFNLLFYISCLSNSFSRFLSLHACLCRFFPFIFLRCGRKMFALNLIRSTMKKYTNKYVYIHT